MTANEFVIGALTAEPAAARLDLVAPRTRHALATTGLAEKVGVVEIDPSVSDTAATQSTFGLAPENLANCVLVSGKREGEERFAACVVLATTRADVNGAVRRFLDVRKASFLPTERAVELTEMEYGGITPIGLPDDWPILIDRRVIKDELVVIGSGVRRSKIVLRGALLQELPGAKVTEALGL